MILNDKSVKHAKIVWDFLKKRKPLKCQEFYFMNKKPAT
jgi:hypothetical protein